MLSSNKSRCIHFQNIFSDIVSITVGLNIYYILYKQFRRYAANFVRYKALQTRKTCKIDNCNMDEEGRFDYDSQNVNQK